MTRTDNREHILKTAIDYLISDDEEFASALLLSCALDFKQVGSYNDEFGDQQSVMVITLSGPPGLFKILRGLKGLEWSSGGPPPDEEEEQTHAAKVIRAALGVALDSVLPDSWIGGVTLRLQSSEPFAGWREEYLSEIRGDKAPSNQAVVASHPPAFAWNGLRFRSKTEMVMAQAFSKRGVLYFPLPAAVSNQRKLEPDFLVCTDLGKWGILEVHGDDWHPPETAAKEHERGRWFKGLGVRFYEVYGATECYHDADGVVDRFLKLLAGS